MQGVLDLFNFLPVAAQTSLFRPHLVTDEAPSSSRASGCKVISDEHKCLATVIRIWMSSAGVMFSRAEGTGVARSSVEAASLTCRKSCFVKSLQSTHPRATYCANSLRSDLSAKWLSQMSDATCASLGCNLVLQPFQDCLRVLVQVPHSHALR